MKNNIIRAILFLLILVIILLLISYIFIPKNNSAEFGMDDPEAMGILGEKDNTIDVLVLGDSEPMASIIPMKMWNDYGISSYVCSTAGQTLPDTFKMAYDVLKKQKPKIIILETNNSYISTKITVPIARIVNIALPITKNHNRWKNLKAEDFFGPIDYRETNASKGYYYVGKVDPADASNYMTYSEEVEDIPTLNKKYVKLLKKYVESKGAKLVMVSVPNTKNWNYARHNAMKKYTEEEKIEFLDLNELKDELKINWNTETGDKGEHVNYYGALKVTNYIGKWLNDKKILKNHRNDPEYKEWNENLKNFEFN